MTEISGVHVVSGIAYAYSASLHGSHARFFYSNAIVTPDPGHRGFCLERPAMVDENAAESEDAVRSLIHAGIDRLHDYLHGLRLAPERENASVIVGEFEILGA